MPRDVFRNRELEPDPADMEIRANYDAIDEAINGSREFDDIEETVDPMFWKEDMEDLLSDIGVVYDGELPLYPEEQLIKIQRFYGSQSETMNDDMMYEEVDPIPNYVAGNESTKRELFKLGYAVGSEEQIGRYYKLLPLIYFARGYWLAKFEKGVEKDDDEMILNVSKEMKVVVNNKTAEKELERIVNDMFTDVVNDEEAPSKREGQYLR